MWAAGRFAVNGMAALAYDPYALNSVMRAASTQNGIGYWMYPPTYLLLARPISALHLWPSAALFQAASILLAAVAARLFRLRGAAILLVVFSPASIASFCYGQNGMLEGAVLASGLFLLPSSPALGGILLGLAATKPQLLLLVPFCLLAGRHRMALLAAGLTCTTTAFVSLLAYGSAAWSAFIVKAPATAWDLVASTAVGGPSYLTVSPLEALVAIGVPLGASSVLQGIIAAACAWLAWMAWRRPSTNRQALVGLTLSLGLLATGYSNAYDMFGLTCATTALVLSARGRLPPLRLAALSFAWAWPTLGEFLETWLRHFVPGGPLVIGAAAWACWASLNLLPDDRPADAGNAAG
jgi:hypothetical protein